MDHQLIRVLGAYAIGILDSAQSRGHLSNEAIQTLVNGLVDIYGAGAPSFTVGTPPPPGAQPQPPPAFDNPQLISQLTDELQRRQAAIVNQQHPQSPQQPESTA